MVASNGRRKKWSFLKTGPCARRGSDRLGMAEYQGAAGSPPASEPQRQVANLPTLTGR
jgi:hypothetical protein